MLFRLIGTGEFIIGNGLTTFFWGREYSGPRAGDTKIYSASYSHGLLGLSQTSFTPL